MVQRSEQGAVLMRCPKTCFTVVSQRQWALVAFGMSVLALALAYVAEFGFGLHPCEMCYWQRIPFAVVIILSLIAWFVPAVTRIMLWLCALAYAVGTGLAVFHAGVEWKWWEGPTACSAGFTPDMTPAELLAHIQQAARVSCADAAIRVLGLSMAGWNALYSLGCTSVLAGALLCKRNEA
jgi:disulfide bond formation protein DsbB